MSDRAGELLNKALHSLQPAERDELLHAVLLGQLSGVGTSLAGLAGPRPSGVEVDRDRLAAVLGRDDNSQTTSRSVLKILPVRLPEADYDRLKEFCQASGFSMAVVIRTLLERFLDEQPGAGSGRERHPGAA